MNLLRRRALLILALPLALAACGESATSQKPATSTEDREFGIPASQAPSADVARRDAKGFETGNKMSARVVYVFFDPQCPHCGMFWQEAKKLERDARFVWIPVAILNKKSGIQGAALLSAQDPAKLMDEHEASLLANQGGIAPEDKHDTQIKAAIAKNTRLLVSFGAEGVPFIVANAADGKTVSGNGRPAEKLAIDLGWKPAATAPEAPAGAPVAK